MMFSYSLLPGEIHVCAELKVCFDANLPVRVKKHSYDCQTRLGESLFGLQCLMGKKAGCQPDAELP